MMTKPPPPQTEFQNTFINDTLTSQRGPTLGDIQKQSPGERATSHLSLSSDEYKSSTNDIRLNVPHPNGGLHPPPNGTTPSTGVSNGNLGPPVQPTVIISNDEYATVNKKASGKERQSSGRKKRHDGDDTGERSKRKHRKSREHSADRKGNKQRHRNRSYEEVGESSKSNGVGTASGGGGDDSRVNQSYDNVEYC